jgi:Tol biopolymer transport system component
MKQIFNISVAVIFSVLIITPINGQKSYNLTGPYLGQKQPGKIPELFAYDIISKDVFNHSNIAISPDGKEICWSTGHILCSKLQDGQWTKPEIMIEDADSPVFSPDDKRLYFNSWRPDKPNDDQHERIWYIERVNNGWSEQKLVGTEINNEHLHWEVSLDNQYNLYFGSERKGTKGSDDIFVSYFVNGKYTRPVSLGSEINTESMETNPFISPDGSYLIFYTTEGLKISYKLKNGSWTQSKKLGDYFIRGMTCPLVSPDKRFFFFLKTAININEIYWVDAGFIEEMRPK